MPQSTGTRTKKKMAQKARRTRRTEEAVSAEAIPKKRGRPAKERPAYTGPELALSTDNVQKVSLAAVNLEDETYQIRFSSKPDPAMVDSVRSIGIQVPLIVRPHPEREGQFQLVCGFRRATSASQVGLETVPVLVRDLSDEAAQVVAYTENEIRKTLRDLDRARAMDKLRRTGRTTAEIACLFRLSDRQVQRVEGLLNYPHELKAALDDENSGISTTSALILTQAKRKFGASFHLSEWIPRAAEINNFRDLKVAIQEQFRQKRQKTKLIFRNKKKGTVLFNMRDLETATEEQKEAARKELEALLEELKA